MSLQFRAFVFRKKKWISIPSHHHTPDGAVHERACARGEGATERGLRVETEMDQLKHNIGLVCFVIASPPRWMAGAAVQANSCSPKMIGKNKLWEGGKCGMNHMLPMRYFAISQL